MNIYYTKVQLGFDIDPDPTGILMASGSSMLEIKKNIKQIVRSQSKANMDIDPGPGI